MVRNLSFADSVRRLSATEGKLHRVNRKLSDTEGEISSKQKQELLRRKAILEASAQAMRKMVAKHQARTGNKMPYAQYGKLKVLAEAKVKLRSELDRLKAEAKHLPEEGRMVDDSDAVLEGVTQEALDAGLLQIQETLSGLLGGKPLAEVPSIVDSTPPKPQAQPVVAPMKKPTVAPAPYLSGLDDLLAECEALP